MAIYAADIQINVKNKGDLRTLESRFKKIEKAAVSLNKTLKGLGRRNAIKVDTRAAMSAISALEARIRGLNRSVNIDARTRESRSGGGSGGVGLPLAAAAFSGGMGRKGMDSFERITKKQMDYVDQRIAQIEQKFDTRAASATNPVAAKMARLKDERSILGNEARAIQKDFQTRLKQQSFRQLRRDIAASEGRYQDLLASPPPPASRTRTPWGSRAEGATARARKQWTEQLRAERAFGNKLRSQIPDAFEAGAGPTRQIEERLAKINELAREQASLKKVVEGENQVTQARVKGNAVRNEVRTLEDKIEQSQVNVARTQARGQKLEEEKTTAIEKQAAAQKDFITKQKQFNTRQAKQKTALDLEKQLATATQNRAKAQQELTKWESAQQKQIDRYGPDNIRRNYAKPGGAIERSTKALAEADRKVAEINDKLRKTGKATDWSGSLAKSKKALSQARAETAAINKLLDGNNKRLAQGNQILNRRTGIQARQKMLGAAGRGAAASAALIPGVAPLAVGGFAGFADGGGMKGAGIGVAIAAAVQGSVAMFEFARASAEVAAEMDRMKIALGGVVPDQESYNTALEKVSTISDKYAISQRVVLKGFTQLQASAIAAGFSVDETANLMEGLLARTLASGKGLEEFKGVMLAASQILSKNKLMAEEARGQIGERIPGFMADLAASMNISMQELDKRMEQGKVTLKDFFKLGEDLLENNEAVARKMANSYANAGQRLAKSVEDLQRAVGPQAMVIGAKFQNMAKVIVDSVTEVIKILNAWRIAELHLTIAIGRTMQFLDDFFKGRLFDEDRLKEGPNEYLARDLEELRILTGQQEILTKKKREQIESETKSEVQRAVNWAKIERRLRSDIQYYEDLNSHGSEYAETQRQINDLLEQFPDKSDDIKKLVEAVREAENAGKSAKATYEDWLDGIEKRLKELENPMYQLTTLVDAASDSFQSSFKEMVKGTKSVGDAFVDMFNRIADAYLDMVAETLAAQASKGITSFIINALPGILGSGTTQGANMPSKPQGMRQVGVGASANNLNRHIDYTRHAAFSSGGYVDRPTRSLIGDAGPEYVLREDQMAGALARFSSGQRGQSVIPVAGSSSSGGIGGGGNVTVSYTGPTLNFNGDEYVPRSSVPEIINAAARQGAKAGEAKMMSNLRNNRGTRASVGL